MELKRCSWVTDHPLYVAYHDKEWGVPVYEDRLLFEFLILEGAQAGLNWLTILKKRAHYRLVFDQFDAEKIARYDQKKIDQLLSDPGIIRNKLKIASTITNAKSYLKLQNDGHEFSQFVWQFVNHKTILNRRLSMTEIPATTAESDAMSKALLKTGFKFVGSTICYAFMQATGMVNDHLVDCYRYPST